MLPYLPVFRNSYSTTVVDAGSASRHLRTLAGVVVPRATTQMSPHARRDDHDPCCPQSPRPVFRSPPGLAVDPDTLALPWVLASLAPSPAIPRLLWRGFSAWQRTPPARDQEDMVWGEAPCTLGRNTFVPWGERPLYLGAKYLCTLGRSPLVPLGEVPLYLGEKPLVPTGETA